MSRTMWILAAGLAVLVIIITIGTTLHHEPKYGLRNGVFYGVGFTEYPDRVVIDPSAEPLPHGYYVVIVRLGDRVVTPPIVRGDRSTSYDDCLFFLRDDEVRMPTKVSNLTNLPERVIRDCVKY